MNSKKHAPTERSDRGPASYDAGLSDEGQPARNREVAGSPGPGAEEGRMSLGELTEAAHVSVRTVRYYISEGLLPPPEGAGPGSSYSRAHLDRLWLIQRLKEVYLPLREIRRRLSGLDDGEVRAILAAGEEPSASEYWAPPDPSLAGARDYLALLETRERYRTEPLALSMPPTPAGAASAPEGESAPPARMNLAQQRHEATIDHAPSAGQSAPHNLGRPHLEEQQEHELWRRIRLGDEAELVISDQVYARHHDRIDWLVRWARKVFD